MDLPDQTGGGFSFAVFVGAGSQQAEHGGGGEWAVIAPWSVDIRSRAEAVFKQYGGWWEPGPFTWLYVPRHQAFWQHVLDIADRDDEDDPWLLMANLPEMVAARTAETRAEADAQVWRLLVEWATEPEPVPVPDDEVIVWDDSDDAPGKQSAPAEGWWFQ